MGEIHEPVLCAIQAIAAQTTIDGLAHAALRHGLDLTGAARGMLALACHPSELCAGGLRDAAGDRAVARCDGLEPAGAPADGAALRCVAESDAASGEIVLRPAIPLADVAGIPAREIARAAADGLVREFQPGPAGDSSAPPDSARSCHGICAYGVHRGRVAAALYVESAAGPFPAEARLVARTVASHAAIALDHLERACELRAMLAQRERERDAARSEARQAGDELGEITNWVAHDLRTPLTSIMGFTQILLDDWANLSAPERETLLTTIDNSSTKMAHIIEELLVMVRLRRGGVERTALDMDDIVKQTQIRLANAIRRQRVQVVTTGDWPAARGYRPWIEAVWTALIRNSLERSDRGQALELGGAAQGDGSVRFWVSDSGPGLSEEDQQSLFIPPERTHDRRRTIQGMSLALVRQVIEQLDGEVGVENEPGRGCTYYFTLPAH